MQPAYFAVGYTKAGGGTSYDYDCDGIEKGQPGVAHGACSIPCVPGYLNAAPRAGATELHCGSTSFASCASTCSVQPAAAYACH